MPALMTPKRPDLTDLPLPPGWREFSESAAPQTYRHLQGPENGPTPAVNLVLEVSARPNVGWIHPWQPGGLHRQGVKVLDIPFSMTEFLQFWPEMLRNPSRLEEWLEEYIDGWCQRERERQGLPPLETLGEPPGE